jgi:hypothetical protein
LEGLSTGLVAIAATKTGPVVSIDSTLALYPLGSWVLAVPLGLFLLVGQPSLIPQNYGQSANRRFRVHLFLPGKSRVLGIGLVRQVVFELDQEVDSYGDSWISLGCAFWSFRFLSLEIVTGSDLCTLLIITLKMIGQRPRLRMIPATINSSNSQSSGPLLG